jgi:uncharacterized protein YecT (DUF1311 family)
VKPAPLLLGLLLALPAAVAAADCGPDANQSELNACAGADLDAADAELNTLYRQMQAIADPETRRLLTLAQRAWLGFRDAECSFAASSVSGGSIYPMIFGECLAGLTAARAADFRRYLACEEGDLSCPLPPAE